MQALAASAVLGAAGIGAVALIVVLSGSVTGHQIRGSFRYRDVGILGDTGLAVNLFDRRASRCYVIAEVNTLKLNLTVAAVLLLVCPAAAELDCRSAAPPVEIRAIWVDAAAIPKTVDGIRRLVRAYHDANINVMFPEVVARGYAVYESSLLARDPRFRGAPDPLPVMIREAHKLGIEIHAWVWVFRAGYAKDRGAILTAHPEWAELSRDGQELSPNGGLWVSPAVEPARDFLADVYAELVRKYDVDGLHLDYVRYESETSASYGCSPASTSLFVRQYGLDPACIQPYTIEQYQWNKFRERQINTFVQRIALQTQRLKPHVKLSAAVAPELKSARLDLMQNWVNWVDNRWLDFVVPMSYSSDDAHFNDLVMADSEATAGRTLLAPGIAMNLKANPQKVVDQIGLARGAITAGQTLFSASYLKPEHAAALRSGPYACPAGIPFRDPQRAMCVLRQQASRTLDPEARCYLLGLADSLESYLAYRRAPIRYVRPAPPPFVVREPSSEPSAPRPKQ